MNRFSILYCLDLWFSLDGFIESRNGSFRSFTNDRIFVLQILAYCRERLGILAMAEDVENAGEFPSVGIRQ
jgi:hypothetical protein